MAGDRFNTSWEECPICFEEYNPENRLPVIWHNTHLTCKPCFYGLRELCCVMCRQNSDLDLYEATCDDMCTQHKDQLYSHYCEQHKMLICNVCLRESHSDCDYHDTVQLKNECNSKIGRLLEELDILKDFIHQRIENTGNDIKCLEVFQAGVKSFTDEYMTHLTEEQKCALFKKFSRFYQTLCDSETLIPVRDSLEDIHKGTFSTDNVVKLVRMAKDINLEEKVRSLKEKTLRPLELIFEKIILELKAYDTQGVLTGNVYFPVLHIDVSPACLSSIHTDDIGNVYVCDSKQACIRKYNRHGNQSKPCIELKGMASDTRGAITVLNKKREMITSVKKWQPTPEGRGYCTNTLDVFSLDTGLLTRTIPVTQFNGIHGLTTNLKGEVIFSDPQRRIVCTLDQDGKVNLAFKTQPERFSAPGEICTGADDTLIVVDQGKNCIQMLKQSDGSVVRKFVPTYNGCEMQQISSVCSDGASKMVVAGKDKCGACMLVICSQDGTGVGLLAGADKLGKVGGLAISKDNRVWVSDVKQECLVKYKSVQDII